LTWSRQLGLLGAFALAACSLQKLDSRAASATRHGGESGGSAADRAGEDPEDLGEHASGGEMGDRQNTGGAGPRGGAGPTGAGGAAGSGQPDAGGMPKGGGGAGPAGPPDAATADPCVAARAHAQRVLETNCAPCHQAPAKQGNFDFCLDVRVLIQAVSSTGRRFVVPGAPEQSRLFQRASAGEMPPPGRMPRPSADDVAALGSWIAGCISSDAPGFADAGAPPARDAAVPMPADDGPCGRPGSLCCQANACDDGGCCVQGRCRANGAACGSSNAGENGDDGVPGTCQAGSCAASGTSCGNVGQPCCGSKASCTAPRAQCSMGTSCQACGGAGQPCCGNGGSATCLAGLDCQGAGFGRVGVCQACGTEGQACCGSGTAAQQTCNAPLTCLFVVGTGARCAL
jgi:hypothetical protein